MLRFNKQVLIIGYGAVARSVLPILLRYVRIPTRNITILDFRDKKKELGPWIAKGVKYFRERVTPHNLTRVLSQHVSPGGLIIDLAWNIDCIDILQWSFNNKVLYVNASVEEWDPYADMHSKSSFEKSLYYRYQKIDSLSASWTNESTAVVDHGANPGLVSHFLCRGLLDIGAAALRDDKYPNRQAKRIERLLEDEDFPRLARSLGVRVIHCSERDTQLSRKPKAMDEFVGLWSIEGMMEEAISPVEMGWGTHEKALPKNAMRPKIGPRNQVILPQMGLNTWVRSWVPDQEFVGMVITHGEAYGISKMLTVRRGSRVIYRPTVHYAYLPANETISSLHDLRCRNYELQASTRIMYDEISSGSDILGTLIMGHPYNSWWTGSILGINEARKLVPHQNATAIQVAIGVVCAAHWTISNPRKGLCYPEDLPYDEMINLARPYLGECVSKPVDWTPLKNYQVFFSDNPDSAPDKDDVWQFKNFSFRP